VRIAFDALDEGILHRLAHRAGEGQELLGRERLPAQEDDAVIEQGLAHLRGGVWVQRLAQVDA
jgi:hypothetical protein